MKIMNDKQVKYFAHDTIPGIDYYVIVLKNSHLAANARIRELEANIGRWFQDHRKLSEAFIRQCDRARRAEAKLQELVEAAEEKDRFFPAEEPGLPDSKERNDFCDAKFRAWERYQTALTAAKEM